MSRKLLFGLIAVTFMGALVGTPAMAHHDNNKPATTDHKAPPEDPERGTLEALCVVDGGVVTNDKNNAGGVGTDFNHNHYEFVDAELECTDVNSNAVMSGGTYAVVARGASDSCLPVVAGQPHGETGAEGCGDGALAPPACTPNFTLGGLQAVRTTPNDGVTILGEVDFRRSGNLVLAFGELCGDLGPGCFMAPLVFTPTDTDGKVNTADLDGTAQVMLQTSPGVCGPGAPGEDS